MKKNYVQPAIDVACYPMLNVMNNVSGGGFKGVNPNDDLSDYVPVSGGR